MCKFYHSLNFHDNLLDTNITTVIYNEASLKLAHVE